jgi:hypothetical protein
VAVEIAWSRDVFRCHKTKRDVLDGEYLFTRSLIDARLNIDTLLAKYGSSVDWRERRNWHCNNYRNPTWGGSYMTESNKGMLAHPLELVFYKTTRLHGDGTFITKQSLHTETLAYLEWTVRRKRNLTFL